MSAKDYSACPLVRYVQPESKFGGGGWRYGRLIEVTPHGVHVIVDHKGTKHRITASDVQTDVTTTAVPTELAQRRPKRMGA